ncbi:hypothetical protein [Brevundimonas sp. NIBR11]|uniref:hypothetical protein n=1 Tax=Brevundimonas sp. NIBR11 TaxID=3015999 RepID=UPI0022F06479|nr:hypothetical protein [Brevundimonas sp. NIBR11]WGM32540.1 hypothetical protein KKHFBJBL_02793 [Brevundimonas sp. NIBR11]
MTARILFSSIVLGAALAASACASGPRSHSTYSEELAQLTADCRAREGILSPVGGGTTGRPQTDYVCEIRGATRLPRN